VLTGIMTAANEKVDIMWFQVVSLVLDVAVGLLAGACLLRLYMQAMRSGFANPVGAFVFGLTNWLVLPLRRTLPALGRIDAASLVAAYLLVLVKILLLHLVAGHAPAWGLAALWALPELARLALSALSVLVLVHVLMSWIQAPHTVKAVIARLAEPLLRPLRQILPPVGGIDLAPLVLLVLLQIAVLLLNGILPTVLR
jgi:YggT family protein